MEELKAPSQSRPHAYKHILQDPKNRTGPGDETGVEDSDYGESVSRRHREQRYDDQDEACLLLRVQGAGESLQCIVLLLCEVVLSLQECLFQALCQPKQLQHDTFHLHGISATGRHIPARLAHDNTVTMRSNEPQLQITHLL